MLVFAASCLAVGAISAFGFSALLRSVHCNMDGVAVTTGREKADSGGEEGQGGGDGDGSSAAARHAIQP